MFTINEDNSIYATRGDVVFFSVKAKDIDTNQPFTFTPGDVLRVKVYAKKNAENVVLSKDFVVTKDTEEVMILLDGNDTKFGDVISKPVDYWYEIELNPDTYPQTIIGYNEDGAVLFKLFPEGDDIEDDEITEADIPVVDAVLDVNSARPVQNQAVAKEIAVLKDRAEIGVIHYENGKIDNTFSNVTQMLNRGIPVMVTAKGEPPAFAVTWNEERINFTAGSYMKVADDFGLIRLRFVKYVLLPNDTFHDSSEMYDLQYTDRYF